MGLVVHSWVWEGECCDTKWRKQTRMSFNGSQKHLGVLLSIDFWFFWQRRRYRPAVPIISDLSSVLDFGSLAFAQSLLYPFLDSLDTYPLLGSNEKRFTVKSSRAISIRLIFIHSSSESKPRVCLSRTITTAIGLAVLIFNLQTHTDIITAVAKAVNSSYRRTIHTIGRKLLQGIPISFHDDTCKYLRSSATSHSLRQFHLHLFDSPM